MNIVLQKVGSAIATLWVANTGTSRVTATRDLQEPVGMGALTRGGERWYRRYWLKLDGQGGVDQAILVAILGAAKSRNARSFCGIRARGS